MMETDERYDDLTALFEAQDAALENDAFVEQVMRPIHKRARWRAPLLFGAGGVGLGAAVSQMGGLISAIRTQTAELNASWQPVDVSLWERAAADPIWIAAIVIVIISCAAIIATERA